MPDTTARTWFYRRGVLTRDGWESVVDPTIDGWRYTGLRTAELDGGRAVLLAEPVERIVVPLSGSFTVRYRTDAGSDEDTDEHADADESVQVLTGRTSVLHGPTDVLYLPTATSAVIEGSGRVAVAEAPTTVRHPVAYIRASQVPVELRGAGRSSRQVHNFGTPQALVAERLIVCEVITPAENWSSYPPHKHDESIPGTESTLEEIYYFETAVTRGATGCGVTPPAHAEPFGYMRTSSSTAGQIEVLEEVHSGDIVLVPFGWHGPCVAPPGYDLYYLNVMAGPDAERSWLITDSPAHAWIRDTWNGQDIDERLPYTAASEGSSGAATSITSTPADSTPTPSAQTGTPS